jgi:hypothetical protein
MRSRLQRPTFLTQQSVGASAPTFTQKDTNMLTGYEYMDTVELLEVYQEAKYMSFMCLHVGDRSNWHRWCRTCAEVQLAIYTKEQL